MMQTARYRALLRSLFASVLQSDLSAADLQALASELRRGRLADELAYMIEQTSKHFRDPPDMASDDLRALERLIKDKRLTKSAVYNIISSIDAGSKAPESATLRQMLQDFLSSASSKQIEKLLDVLGSVEGVDPYLKGITDRER
ncbi:hypothetical protein [Caulobacter hibisci]|uniref:Uncharacterized protein n=1 Tax=Caulobacter hibisci TaxID=2035993 RepID=A0ABS0T514_9CAUL|nr:hypothetical protein [Caulobacter hibisci]MBI1686959.1 hypothetical protein [Caulobacter hibisci]